MPFTTAEIAKLVGGEVVGDSQAVLKSFAPAERAQAGDLTFAENEDFFARAEQSAATAIIADQRFSSANKILIRVPNARVAFAKAMALFFPERKYCLRNPSDGGGRKNRRKLIRPRISVRIAPSANA